MFYISVPKLDAVAFAFVQLNSILLNCNMLRHMYYFNDCNLKTEIVSLAQSMMYLKPFSIKVSKKPKNILM